MVGVGGGFVLVPVLLLLYPDRDPEEITAISLAVVFANSVSGAAAFARQGRIDYRSGWYFAGATLPGALLGAFVVRYTPRAAFEVMFSAILGAIGLFLLLQQAPTGIREPERGERGIVRRMLRDRSGQTFFYSYNLRKGVRLTAVIGFFSSLLGIGGGVIQVPMMTTVLRFPVHIATATSQFILAFMAGEGSIVHLVSGSLRWDESLATAGLLALGAVPGAQLGAFAARHIAAPLILRLLSVTLILVAIRLGLKAAGWF